MKFEVYHQDHGVTLDQMDWVQSCLEAMNLYIGFFIREIPLPPSLGTVPCGLHGPIMEDAPIDDEQIVYWQRGDRPYVDRCIDRPVREVSYVQAIGVMREDGSCLLYTVYGGPLAPMNPEDQGCPDREASLAFWADHALSIPPESEG